MWHPSIKANDCGGTRGLCLKIWTALEFVGPGLAQPSYPSRYLIKGHPWQAQELEHAFRVFHSVPDVCKEGETLVKQLEGGWEAGARLARRKWSKWGELCSLRTRLQALLLCKQQQLRYTGAARLLHALIMPHNTEGEVERTLHTCTHTLENVKNTYAKSLRIKIKFTKTIYLYRVHNAQRKPNGHLQIDISILLRIQLFAN